MEMAAAVTSISQERRSDKGKLQQLFFSSSSLDEEFHDSVAQPGRGPASNEAAKLPDLEQFLKHHFSLREILDSGNV